MTGTEHDHDEGDPVDDAERLDVFGPPAELPAVIDAPPCPICGAPYMNAREVEQQACDSCYTQALAQGLRLGRHRSRWGRSR